MAGLFRLLLAGPRPDLFLAASIHGGMMVYIMLRIIKSSSIAAQLGGSFRAFGSHRAFHVYALSLCLVSFVGTYLRVVLSPVVYNMWLVLSSSV